MQQKISYIVFLRCLATIAVVMNHTALVALGTYKTPSYESCIIVHTIVNIVHFAVPVFVMITGALLLDERKCISFEKAIKYYSWRMVVVLFTIGIAFALMEEFYLNDTLSLSLIVNSLKNVVTGNSWEHMWYIYMLIGLYLCIPFFKSALKNLKLHQVDCFCLILFLFSSFIPIIDSLFDIKIGISFPIASIYVLYLILGWRITKIDTDSWIMSNSRILLVVFVIISILIGVCGIILEYKYNLAYNALTTYNSPIEVLLGFIIFSYAYANQNKLDRLANNSIIKMIDKNSFGIYLFHMFWINIIYKLFKFNPLDYDFFVYIILVVILIILSIVSSEIYRRIPFIGKFV